MNHPQERLDAYLWDPTAPPDASVAEIERRLAAARFDATVQPLPPGPRDATPRVVHDVRWWASRLAWAAAIFLVVGAAWATWRWSWPDGRSWDVATSSGSPSRLVIGATLETDGSESAVVHIARIGIMQVAGDTTLRLRSTASNRHRLVMEDGTVRVRVWAPPFSVSFRTPAGEVSDLGCEFELTVDGASTRVDVMSGWVQLENLLGETLVPAGAASEMTVGTRPGVPVFTDAPAGFLEAVRSHERNSADPEPVNRMLELARRRDVYTLLQLVRRSPAGVRLTGRAAQLFAPPAAVDPARVAAGDVDGLDRWITELPLPSPKSTWLWNWRDGFSFRSARAR